MSVLCHPSPLSLEDDACLLYGHLMVAAEDALKESPRVHQLALLWLCGVALHDGARLWKMELHDACIGEKDLGDWSVRIRLDQGRPEPIGLERRSFLISEGREIASMAHPFSTEDGSHENLAEFCVVTLAAAIQGPALRRRLTAKTGVTADVLIRKRRLSKFFSDFLPLKNRGL